MVIQPDHIGQYALVPGRKALRLERIQEAEKSLGLGEARGRWQYNLNTWYHVSARLTHPKSALDLEEVYQAARALYETRLELQRLEAEVTATVLEPSDDEVKVWVVTKLLTHNNQCPRR